MADQQRSGYGVTVQEPICRISSGLVCPFRHQSELSPRFPTLDRNHSHELPRWSETALCAI